LIYQALQPILSRLFYARFSDLGTIDKKSCLFGIEIVHAVCDQGFLAFDDVAI